MSGVGAEVGRPEQEGIVGWYTSEAEVMALLQPPQERKFPFRFGMLDERLTSRAQSSGPSMHIKECKTERIRSFFFHPMHPNVRIFAYLPKGISRAWNSQHKMLRAVCVCYGRS